MNCDTILLYHFIKAEVNKVCKIYQNKKKNYELLKIIYFHNKLFMPSFFIVKHCVPKLFFTKTLYVKA